MATPDHGKNFTLVTAAILLLSAWAGGLNVVAQNLEFDVYTFTQDSSVKVGYPRGWTVQEGGKGVAIREKMADDSAVVLILVGKLLRATTNEQLAESVINGLRQSGYPDLKVAKQQPYPKAQDILAIDATFSVVGVPFQSYIWCVVDQQSELGIFANFYAPKSRYGEFNAQWMLFSSLSPMLGLEGTMDAETGSEAYNLKKDILYIRKEDTKKVLCSIDPSSEKITRLKDFGLLPVAQPTRSPDGSVIILAIPNMKRLLVVQGIRKYEQDLPTADAAFSMVFASEGESYVYSPSISRDNSLVAVRILLSAGGVAAQETNTVAHDHNSTAFDSRGRLTSFRIGADIQEHALYHEDPESQDVDAHRLAWYPAFSPVEDVLAYMDGDEFVFVDAKTGETVRRITPKTPVQANSGFTFSPDGGTLAYMAVIPDGVTNAMPATDAVVTLDIAENASREYLLENIRPTSMITGSNVATIALDFSPDGRSIVFCAEPRGTDKPGFTGDIYILDLDTGRTRQLTTDGKSFDPVWKGR